MPQFKYLVKEQNQDLNHRAMSKIVSEQIQKESFVIIDDKNKILRCNDNSIAIYSEKEAESYLENNETMTSVFELDEVLKREAIQSIQLSTFKFKK